MLTAALLMTLHKSPGGQTETSMVMLNFQCSTRWGGKSCGLLPSSHFLINMKKRGATQRERDVWCNILLLLGIMQPKCYSPIVNIEGACYDWEGNLNILDRVTFQKFVFMNMKLLLHGPSWCKISLSLFGHRQKCRHWHLQTQLSAHQGPSLYKSKAGGN